MRWLKARTTETRGSAQEGNHENGAVTVLTAVLMVVLLLMAAMVLNVGMLYSEKAQLQNAADAAALAIAGCNSKTPACTQADSQTLAGSLTNGNSNDGASKVDGLDFGIAGQVTVTTSTMSSGNGFLSLPFAGITGISEGRVTAKATAIWTKTTYTVAVPITFGECEIDATLYPFDGTNRAILTHGSTKCDSNGTPHVLPGGFGWMDAINCKPIIDSDHWAGSDTGNNNKCPSLFTQDLIGRTVLVPIFDSVGEKGGNNGKFHISSWGLFVVKGFKVDSSIVGEWSSGGPGNSDRGLYGHFVKKLSYAEGLNWSGSFTDGSEPAKLIK
ncbi:hypothetical protein MB46_02345 [Arthrobacter alpinus]|uniref:pilus assembly protein TadG-related protein n=1 Tax=Arthrobacter alpinus TaxID=656366 RepID=UPI0005C8FBE6|nr:pilus assembly protein TadG-related protein [Arthrobacter alpinus]ALV44530.1 hypothetical protein MB46_02345 [Arthrobacter alpinus]